MAVAELTMQLQCSAKKLTNNIKVIAENIHFFEARCLMSIFHMSYFYSKLIVHVSIVRFLLIETTLVMFKPYSKTVYYGLFCERICIQRIYFHSTCMSVTVTGQTPGRNRPM